MIPHKIVNFKFATRTFCDRLHVYINISLFTLQTDKKNDGGCSNLYLCGLIIKSTADVYENL